MICDFAAWRPITANFTKGGMAPIRGFIPHVQVGTGSLHDFFSNPKTQASAHFWISKTGTLEQYVDTDDKAWAEAAGNPYFISCEFEGQPDESMTSQQLDMGGQLIAWVYGNVGQFPLVVNDDPNGSGITPHYAGGRAWGGHSCPGPLRFQQYDELVLATLRYLDGPTPAPDPPPAPLPPEDETVQLIYVVQKGSDGRPTGPVFLSWGREARIVSTFADEEYVETLLGNKIIPAAGRGSAEVKDGAGQTRDVVLADNLAAYGVK